MAGLPKKYAKMGFKKGWAAYRRSKSPRRARAATPKRKVRTMARRRYYGRRKRGGSRKHSMVSTVRGAVYVAIPALTTYSDYTALKAAGRDGPTAFKEAVVQWGGINPTTHTFSTQTVIDQYTPLLAWTVADMAASRLGVWRKMGRLLRF